MYFKQLSADNKMENYKFKTRFVIPEEQKAKGTNMELIYDFYFNIRGKLSSSILYMMADF